MKFIEKYNFVFYLVMGFGLFHYNSSALAADGQMHFTGNILAVTCDISGPGGSSGDFTVKLPDISTDSLKSGRSGGQTSFEINLSGANCTNGKTASIIIETTKTPNLDLNRGTLRNTGGSNVELALLNANTGQVINLYTGENMPNAVIAGNSAKLKFIAEYQANNGDATEGTVISDATYTVTYN